jgi:hypothetical protein
MTLEQALAKANTSLERLFTDAETALRDEYRHATPEELAAILARHRECLDDARRQADVIVRAAWFSGSGTVH